MSVNAQRYVNGTVLSDLADYTCSRTGPQCADDCTTLIVIFFYSLSELKTFSTSQNKNDFFSSNFVNDERTLTYLIRYSYVRLKQQHRLLKYLVLNQLQHHSV